MNLKLVRLDHLPTGIFGKIVYEDGKDFCVTLEHAYSDGNGGWSAKIYPGSFQCVRGSHQLESMNQPFETFEITGVEGHTNLLFHWGNWNQDSSGCVLLGKDFVGGNMITHSRETFSNFMALQAGLDQFQLTVC